MSVASIGTISTSSGTSIETLIAGKRLVNLLTETPTISSAASQSFSIFACPPLMRVMDKRFSTMRMSHCASSFTSSKRRRFCSGENESSFSRIAAVLPTMLVSGVRISCDIARRRLARTASFSVSMRSRSCFLICVFIALIIMDTVSIARKVNG